MYDSGGIQMSKIMSIRFSKEEHRIIESLAAAHGLSMSAMVKKLAFDHLEDEFDLQAIRAYEADVAAGRLKSYTHEEVMRDIMESDT